MKQIIKTLTFLLLIVVNVQLSFAGDVWDGSTIATGFYSGTGTKDDPYTIYTGSQFAYFYTEMANNERTFEGQYIEVRNDIDMGEINMNTLKTSSNKNTVFCGHFNGGNHTIVVNCGYSYDYHSSYEYLLGELHGTVHNVYFDDHYEKPNYSSFSQCSYLAQIYPNGEVYNCYFASPAMHQIVLAGGMIANCASGSAHWQNSYKYGGASGLCSGKNGLCYNCNFDGCVFLSYGRTQADNYGEYGTTRENNGALTPEEHNQWVSDNSTSDKVYKTWPLTFIPAYPPYNVTVSFADNSLLTNYTSKTLTAGNECVLPVPVGFESEFLGWEYNGTIFNNSIIPTDNIVCSAKWKHYITKQPTLLNTEVLSTEKSSARFQWNKGGAKSICIENPQNVSKINVPSDNMVMYFDYIVDDFEMSGRYDDYECPGYVSIDGVKIIYVEVGDARKEGTMKYVFEKAGEHTFSKSNGGVMLSNMSLSYPSHFLDDALSLPPVETLDGETTNVLSYSYLKPKTGVYFCDIIYNDQVIQSDVIDTYSLFEQDGNIYAPVNETDIALLKVGTDAESCTIPQSVAIVGSNAFADCANLKSVTVEAVIPPSIMMGDYDVSSYTLYVPFQSVSTYKREVLLFDFSGCRVETEPH